LVSSNLTVLVQHQVSINA